MNHRHTGIAVAAALLCAVAAGITAPSVFAQNKGEEKTLIMDRIRIRGQIERPEAVYIIDVTNPNFKPIRIERSFQNEILEPVDKDDFEDELKRKEK